MKRTGICDYCHEGSGVRRLCTDCADRVTWWEALTPSEKQDEYDAMAKPSADPL